MWLGVDAIWLSPFYPSPNADFGYDVSDYCAVDPVYGTMDDFDGLVADAHARASASSWTGCPTTPPSSTRGSSTRGAVATRRTATGTSGTIPVPRGPPNNWVSTFAPGPAWTFDEASGQWYLHLFEPGQPDLNWDEPAVVTA